MEEIKGQSTGGPIWLNKKSQKIRKELLDLVSECE